MIGVDTLQALLETSELRADLAEGKVEALRMKVATSLEVIENLKDQIQLLEAELADVRDLVPVDGVDEPCALHGREECCHVECLTTEEDFLDELLDTRAHNSRRFAAEDSMELSDMTDEQLAEGLAAARETFLAADRVLQDYNWERRNRADAEFERRLTEKREPRCSGGNGCHCSNCFEG